MVNAFADYGANRGAQPGGSSNAVGTTTGYWSLERLKRAYQDYIGSKRDEIREQQDSRRYRHGTQWTSEQMKVFNKRKQPVVTYNHIAPKINGVIGLIEKLRQAPKAYPRTPKEEEGADLATAVIRFVLDEQHWKSISPICAEDAAVDGYGGIELLLEQGDQGDPEIGFAVVESDSFFYDPRSYNLDFSDCRYMGQGKWLDMEQAKEMFPDQADKLQDSIESGSDLTTNADREQKWFISDGDIKRVRLIDHWYKMNGEWCWCIYTGSSKLDEGKSYLTDEKGKSACKYLMFSANIDQDGDRYGFVRQFKSPQDEINQRRSKALHTMNTRRIVAEDGAFDDIEKTRVEATRPDGVIIRNKGFEAEFDDATRMQETEAQLKFLQEAKNELDSYGPTLSLIGEVGANLSGRAISLQQQAGIAQLGPFILSLRSWKIRVYRAVWNAIRQHWKAERWVRVTDDENAIEFVGLNQVGINPQTGLPAMVNHVPALDVDIIMDEGPDTINMMADTYDALNALAQNGAQIPPAILLELAPGIDAATKKRLIAQLTAPDPMAQAKQQMEMQNAQATIAKTTAQGKLANAQAIAAIATVGQSQNAIIEQPENPAVVAADIENTHADTLHKKAQALKAMGEAVMAPQQQAHDQGMDRVQVAQQAQEAAKPDPAQEAQAKKAQADDEDRQLAREEKKQRLEMDRSKQQHEMSLKERELTLKAKAHNKQLVDEKALSEKVDHEPKATDIIAEKLDRMHQHLHESISQLSANQKELSQQVNAPIEVQRDKSGRIGAVKKGNRTYHVKRENNRITGAV
jgi:hypothetical protein